MLEELLNTPLGQFFRHLVKRFVEEFPSKGYSKILDEISRDKTVVSIDKQEIFFRFRRYEFSKMLCEEINRQYGKVINEDWEDTRKFFLEYQQFVSFSQQSKKSTLFQQFSETSLKLLSENYEKFFQDVRKYFPGFTPKMLEVMLDIQVDVFLDIEYNEPEYFGGILDLVKTKNNKKQSKALALLPLYTKSHKVDSFEKRARVRKQAIQSFDARNPIKIYHLKEDKLAIVRELYAIIGESNLKTLKGTS